MAAAEAPRRLTTGVRPSGGAWHFVAAALLLGSGGLLVGIARAEARTGPSKSGVIVAVLLAVACLALGAWLAFTLVRRLRSSVVLEPHGIVATNVFRKHRVAWDAMAKISTGAVTSMWSTNRKALLHPYIVRKQGGNVSLLGLTFDPHDPDTMAVAEPPLEALAIAASAHGVEIDLRTMFTDADAVQLAIARAMAERHGDGPY